MTNNKIILGFTGQLSSGKGTSAEYLVKKYQADTFKFSTILRDLVDRIHVPQTRDNLIKISEFVRGTFGEDTLSKTIAEDAKNATNSIIIIDGIRRMADIEHLFKLPNFILIEIFADPKIRFERLVKRGENEDDKTKTYEQFLADHERSTEISIKEVIAHATERIDNNGTLEDLYKQLDGLVERHVNI